MKKILEFADNYIRECNWKDISLLKICLCALGFMLGLSVEKKYKKPAMLAAWCVFCVTYVPLMVKCIDVLVQGFRRKRELIEVPEEAEEADDSL